MADTGAWRDVGTRRADKCTHPVRLWRVVWLSTAWWHFQPEGHGPVIDEADLHIGAKLPLRRVRPLFAGALAQKGEQLLAMCRWCGGSETWAITFARIGCQSKLWHQEQSTVNVAQTQIHFPFVIGKDTVIEHALQKTHSVLCRVMRLNADQRQNAAPNTTYRLIIDIDMR